MCSFPKGLGKRDQDFHTEHKYHTMKNRHFDFSELLDFQKCCTANNHYVCAELMSRPSKANELIIRVSLGQRCK